MTSWWKLQLLTQYLGKIEASPAHIANLFYVQQTQSLIDTLWVSQGAETGFILLQCQCKGQCTF